MKATWCLALAILAVPSFLGQGPPRPEPAAEALDLGGPMPARLAGDLDARIRRATAAPTTTALCGRPTKAGTPCRRKVKGGGPCYQHRGDTDG